MFVKSCKVRPNTPFDPEERGIKIIATRSERDAFLLGAEKVHATDVARYDDFNNHIFNDWREHVPATKEEKDVFAEEQAYSLELNESELKNVVSFWFWLCSYFENKAI